MFSDERVLWRRAGAAVGALALAAALSSAGATAASADSEPFEVMAADALAAFDQLKGTPAPVTSIVAVDDAPGFDRALQIDVLGEPVSAGLDGEYAITLGAGNAARVVAGDAVAATFWARRVAAEGTGQANVVFERNGNPYTKSAVAALGLTGDWQHFVFPFRMAETYAPGEAHLQLYLGYGIQTLQIAEVSILDYGQGTPAAWPTVTYEGREADAAWRQEAAERIDTYRKGDLTVRVVAADGSPVSGADVAVDMQEQAFDFGSAITARNLLADTDDGAAYRRTLAGAFSQATLANDLKQRYWEDQDWREQTTLPALEWLRTADMRVYGHNIVWGSCRYLPATVCALVDDPEALRARMDAHVADETSSLTGIVDVWDVVNEPYSEHKLTDVLGLDEIGRWYRIADQGAPDAALYVNDYGLIEADGANKRHQDFVYDLLADQLAQGAPIDGLGLQAHFSGLQPTAPEDIIPILDRYAALGVELAVTEFDINTDDAQLQADYTRDFLTLMYSYPLVKSISTWGFWAGDAWTPNAPLYNRDFSPKLNGQVWEDLVTREWWTNAAGTTDTSGRYSTRGFLGDYLVTLTVDGVAKQVRVSMPDPTGATVTVVADGVPTTVAADIGAVVLNGGFEDGTAGWVALAPGTSTDPDAGTGEAALRLTGGAGVSQSVLDLEPGTDYLLSAWGRTTGDDEQCYVGVRGGGAPGETGFQYVLTPDRGPHYRQQVATFTAPDDGGWTQVFVWQNAGLPGDPACLVDDVTITPVAGQTPAFQAPPRVAPALPETSVNVLSNPGGELGSVSGWYCLGTCTYSVVTDRVHSGTYAMSAANRAANWVGLGQRVWVSNGGRYDASAWVRLRQPGTAIATTRIKLNTTDNGSPSITFATAQVTGDEWTPLSASDVEVAWTGTLSTAEWWISTTAGTPDLLIDDLSFAVASSDPSGENLLADPGAEPPATAWACDGCAAATTGEQHHSGASALLVTDRQHPATGAAQEVALDGPGRYKSSVWLRPTPGGATSTATVAMRLTTADGNTTDVPLASGRLKPGRWTELAATDVPLEWDGDLVSATWHITTDGTGGFYLDDAALQPAGPESTPLRTVVPTAPCVTRTTSGDDTAYFGYANPNPFTVPIPAGAANVVKPDPVDRGQPEQFAPGVRQRSVALEFTGGAGVRWTLNGAAQKVSPGSPGCS